MDNPASPVECELETTGAIEATFCSRPQQDRFLVTTNTGLIDVWQLESGVPARLTSFKHGDTSVGLASFSGDGSRVISLGEDRTHKIWDIASQALMVSYEASFQ
jgi:WD40 repeat protein